MTKDEIILANREFLFPSVFHYYKEPQAALAKKIASVTPGGRLTKSFFTNSGTEANETAILAARCYTGNTEIVALRHSYHGRSAMAMTLTGQGSWRLGLP